MGGRRSMDVSKMSAAVSRPGIDPRVWLTLAIVRDVGFDPKEGVFADVQFQPGGEQETAYFGTSYAGNGFGEHNPLKVDDTVLVAIPNGDPQLGPIIVARFNNTGDPPPADFGVGNEPSEDRILVVEKGKRYIIKIGAGSSVNIIAEAGAIIRLGGDETALLPLQQGVVQGEAIDPFTGLTQALLGNASLSVLAKKGP